jgi:WD40 repeat protein
MSAARSTRIWLTTLVIGISIGTGRPVRSAERGNVAAPTVGGQVYAIAVGIERYDEGPLDFPPCRGAARDAASFARWMIESARWGPDHVRLLTDEEPAKLGFVDPARTPEHERPTRAALERATREWLASKADPGNVLVVFFAGHAVSLPAAANAAPDQPPRDYLLPVDASARRIDQTGWRLGDAIETFAARGETSIVCLLDTSPSGRLRTPRAVGADLKATAADRFLKGVARWPGVTAWLAASSKPSSVNDDGDGLLTAAIIQGLGTTNDARNLLGCLDRVRRAPGLVSQGFRTHGGFGPDLDLWPSNVPIAPPKLEPLIQDGHSHLVTSVAFSSDGDRLYTSSLDSTVRIWRSSDRVLTRVVPGLINGVKNLAVSADGRLLVAGGGMGELLFYNLQLDRQKPLPDPVPHKGPVEVAILADGRTALSLDNQGRCLLWSARASEVSPVAGFARAGVTGFAVSAGATDSAFALVVPGDEKNDKVLVFNSVGEPVRTHKVALGRISAVAISDDGRRVVIGTEKGTVVDVDGEDKRIHPDLTLSGPIKILKILPTWLAVAADKTLRIIPNDPAIKEPDPVTLAEPIFSAAFSANGTRLAAVGEKQGSFEVWEVADNGGNARRLPIAGQAAFSMGFAPGGDVLVAGGDASGRIRRWRLPEGIADHIAEPAKSQPVRHVAVARDGRAMLQININADNRDRSAGDAILWLFGEARGTKTIPGKYFPTGGFLNDGTLALLDESGSVCLLDSATLARREITFDRPLMPGGARRFSGRFDRLIVSPDGATIAASSSNSGLACVWTAGNGRLIHEVWDRVRGRSKLNTIDFSGDGRLLLTGGDNGLVNVWGLSAKNPPLERTLEPDAPKAGDAPGVVKAAAFSPKDSGRIVVGRSMSGDSRIEGLIELWTAGTPAPQRLGRLDGSVCSVAFSQDGATLAAAGEDLHIALFEMNNGGRPVPLGKGASPNHYESIQSLAFWADKQLLVSASDDATIRLWRLADHSLIGTFSGSRAGSDWVFFTPNGGFDASPDGERRVTWRREIEPGRAGEGEIVNLEQLHDQRFSFNLAGDALADLLENKPLVPFEPLPSKAPPQIQIEPVSALDPSRRDVELRIRLSDAKITDLRLYQNGVAVNGDLKPTGTELKTSIKLVEGDNRIYALAGREGSIDGRSKPLNLTYGAKTPGRTHVLAIGVSKYKDARQSLRFAHADAEALAGFLARRGIGAGANAGAVKTTVLTNDDVSEESIERAFKNLFDDVRGHPEDTVVVFLAGHADVRREFFCLLLSSADLPNAPPAPSAIALRGPAANVGRQPPPLKDPTVLPYFQIHRYLSILDALKRLVIIDACQAEAIFDDPGLKRSIRRQAESGAYKSRTSYILATRRGGRAIEPAELKHGLLTFLLLHGMGEKGLAAIDEVKVLRDYPTADFDNDGYIDTSELQQYVRLTTPALVAQFPAFEGRGAGLAGNAVRANPGRPNAGVSADAADSKPFPIAEAPRP